MITAPEALERAKADANWDETHPGETPSTKVLRTVIASVRATLLELHIDDPSLTVPELADRLAYRQGEAS